MKRMVFVLCLMMISVSAFAARNPQEIKADIAKAQAAVITAKAAHMDATEAKKNLVAFKNELLAINSRRASHLDQGGEVCEDAVLISEIPFFDNGSIGESTGDDYAIDSTENFCGTDGSDLVYRLDIGENGQPAGTYTIGTCGSFFDTVVELWDTCPDNETRQLVACNDDIEEENEGDICSDDNNGLSSCIPAVELAEGTYYLVIFGYDFSQGDYSLFINRDSDCAGQGLGCHNSAENSTCDFAEQVVFDGTWATYSGNSAHGSFPFDLEYCGTQPEACGVWYEVVGNGNRMSASTCSEFTNYDTKINVYTGSCNNLVCVTGNDDSDCFFDLASYVEWCSVEGESYFIFVNGWNGETGDFELTIWDSEVPCCSYQDYYFTAEQVPFCQCLTICPGQIQKIFVGPASEFERPVATWSIDCAADRNVPGGCASDCYPAYPQLYMEWVYLWDRQLWCMDIYSDQGGCYCFCIDQLLPVELNSFTAVAGDGEVALNWSTASESNLDRFEIVRDGQTLTNVPANNSATGATYSWTDESALNGTTYSYSLVSVNLDGSRENLATQSATPQIGEINVTDYALMQNYPNPFNPETTIAFSIPEVSNVELRVFNALGQEVAVLANGVLAAGHHEVKFNGQGLTSGLYFYSLKAGNFSAQNKMLLLK